MVPGNFIDSETGETLRPLYKEKDAMGFWHQKELAYCSWSELYNFGVGIWNVQMSELVTKEEEISNVGAIDKVKILSIWLNVVLSAVLIILLMAVFG